MVKTECSVSEWCGCLRISDEEGYIAVNVSDMFTTFHVSADNGVVTTRNLSTALQLFRSHGNLTVDAVTVSVQMKHSRRPDDHDLTVWYTSRRGPDLYNFYVKDFDSFVNKIVALNIK